MARLPRKEELGGPADLRPRGGIPQIRVPDASGIGIGAGLADLGRGISQGASSAAAAFNGERQKRKAADLIRADAYDLTKKAELATNLASDNDYPNWPTKYRTEGSKITSEGAALIDDKQARENWTIAKNAETEISALKFQEKARLRDNEVKQGATWDSLTAIQDRFAKAPDETTKLALIDKFDDYIDSSVAGGLFSGEQGIKLKSHFRDGTLTLEAEKILRDEGTSAARRKLGMPPTSFDDLWDRVEWQESRGKAGAVSPRGAYGVAQLMPKTAAKPGFGIEPAQWATGTYDPSNPADVAENRRVGRDYLAAMLNRYGGDVEAALVAYNSGPDRADKWIESGKKSPLFKETQDYVGKILGGSDLFARMAPEQRAKVEEALIKEEAEQQKPGHPVAARRRFEPPNDTPAPFNRADKDEQAHANAYVQSQGWTDAILAGDKEVVPNMAEWAAQYDYIPKDVIGTLEGMLNSQDPGKMGYALHALTELEKTTPLGFRDAASDQTEKTIETFRDVRAFTDDDKIVGQHMIDTASDIGKREGDEARRSEGEAYAKKRFTPWVTGLFVSGTGDPTRSPGVNYLTALANPNEDVPSMPEGTDLMALRADAERMYGEAFAYTGGDNNKSYALLKKGLLKKWGVSNVSGVPRIMRNPPERLNPKGVNPEWLMWQANARVGPLVGEQPFILESDDRTDLEIQQGNTQTYIVMVPKTAGQLLEERGAQQKAEADPFFVIKKKPKQKAGM